MYISEYRPAFTTVQLRWTLQATVDNINVSWVVEWYRTPHFRHCHPECTVERPGVSKRRPRRLGERLHAAQGDGERSEEEVTDALGLASKILVTAAAIASEVRRSWAANWSLISASSSAETAPRKDDWASCPQAGGPACGPWGSVRRLLPRSGRSRSSRVCCHRLFWKSAGSLVLRLTIIIIFFRFVFCEKKAPNDSRFFARKRCEYLGYRAFAKQQIFAIWKLIQGS